MSDDDLKKLFDHARNVHYYQKATAELKKRGGDIDFIFPHFIEMVLSNNTTNMMLGWAGLKEFFSDRVKGVDLSSAPPTSEARARLKEIKNALWARFAQVGFAYGLPSAGLEWRRLWDAWRRRSMSLL